MYGGLVLVSIYRIRYISHFPAFELNLIFFLLRHHFKAINVSTVSTLLVMVE